MLPLILKHIFKGAPIPTRAIFFEIFFITSQKKMHSDFIREPFINDVHTQIGELYYIF